MIQQESQVKVIDNTGAKSGRVIRVLKGSFPTYATVGDKVVIAIKSAVPGGQASKGEVAHAVVVRTRKEVKRPDGSYIRFGDNAVALVGKDGAPRGKRIFGPVAKELRSKGYKTVANMAEEII
ncbi:50S ribosomal protein L14 [Candidatus Absconditicoccus praedator]|uniref:50S ribosomal protein L14 n=1 Tax=Candidatus Absconditicoccus praedator TaxID=2735562 RepID=UPI001E653D78|nr:50S ribosomal protein L14 [Candidatus Absconditicoccus praedator]UFX82779.1 50S ribosomal protein L14 [Candidatus Absconditicoccus praedator]